MSDPEALVPLQIPVRKRVRQRLKNAATNAELTMAILGDLLLDHGLTLIESGKAPPALTAAIEKARKAKDAEASD
jgi:hypothetical protein